MATDSAASERVGWRHVVFALVAAAFAFLGLTGLDAAIEGLMPWVIIGCPDCEPGMHPELQRWHGAVHGAMVGMLLSGSLILLLWRSSAKPLLLQFCLLGHVLLLTGFHVFAYQPWFVFKPAFSGVFLVADVLLVAAYPARRALLDFGRREARRGLLAPLALIATVALAPRFGINLWRQITGVVTDEHAHYYTWAEEVILCAALAAAGWLVTTKRGGWKELGALVGVVYVYLGVAAIKVPEQPGSWGVFGGVLSLALGVAYLGATWTESRAAAHPARAAPAP